MNRQDKGRGQGRGIEWTDFTWSPIGGCPHACEWVINGQTAICYAKTMAERLNRMSDGRFYGSGFAHHYWHPERLSEPLKVRRPALIFLDAMSDAMATHVPVEQINRILDVCRNAHWHVFQLLTKNPPRLLKFDFPANVWVGVSSPPDSMFGRAMSEDQRNRYMRRAFGVLRELKLRGKAQTVFVSAEPLTLEEFPAILRENQGVLDWLIVGAASIGPAHVQPRLELLEETVAEAEAQKIPLFFKGNINPTHWAKWREEFPENTPPIALGTRGVNNGKPSSKPF